MAQRFSKASFFPFLAVWVLSAFFTLSASNTIEAADEPAAPPTVENASPGVASLSEADCKELSAAIAQLKGQLSRETGQLKREIAALRQDVSKPGVKEIFAGIGYIFGLAGVGLYVQSRRSSQSGRKE